MDTNISQPQLYLVTFRVPDRPAERFGVSRIEIAARSQTEALLRAGLNLDAIGVREWTLVSVEAAA